jgi:aspartyl/asparaginyl beta-hydroxylase (cupin superfamily)
MRERVHELIVSAGSWLIQRLELVIAWGSRVGNPAFFDAPAHPGFAWTRNLEKQWEIIRDELDAVLEHRELLPSFHDISKDQRRISDDRWKTYFFCAYGINAEGNRDRCPETSRLIDAIPGMKTAFFSILAPGKHIPPHRGPFKGVIRYHLGLVVPEPRARCRIRVGTEIRHWEEGKGIMFDDTYEHEVWNDTPGTRVVLFLDVVRPLRFPANLLNWLVLQMIAHSPYIQDGAQNYRAWEKKLDQVGNARGRKEKVPA